MSEVENKVRSVLAALPYLYLSTASSDEPWVAGGFFAESDPFTLVMVLETRGKTLANIRVNPHVALVVSSGSAFEPFLQASADVVVLTDEQEVEDVKAALRAKAPQVEPFLNAPIEAVRLHVRRWRVTDVVNGWLPGKEIEPPAA